jgi:hypothetical protein
MVHGYDVAAMETAFCRSCGTEVASDDNFCRRCGAATGLATLPAVRNQQSVTVWQPHIPPATKAAAVMAAGAVGQFLLRRAVGNALGGGHRARARRKLPIIGTRDRDGMTDEAQIITETVMLRRVRIRRPEE